MKKLLLALILSIALAFVLTGCSSNTTTTTDDKATEEESLVGKWEGTKKVDDVEMTILLSLNEDDTFEFYEGNDESVEEVDKQINLAGDYTYTDDELTLTEDNDEKTEIKYDYTLKGDTLKLSNDDTSYTLTRATNETK